MILPLLALLALSRIPIVYTATGTVIYDPAGYTPDVLQSILKTDPTTDTIVASQAAILGSLSIAHRVATALDLTAWPQFAPDVKVTGPGRFQQEERARAVDVAVLHALFVAPVDASRVFAVSFTAPEAGLAAQVANRTMELYIGDQLALKTAALRAATQWMSERATELRAKALEQDAAIAQYRQQYGLIAGVQAQLGTEEISRLSADLLRAEDDLASARARRDVSGGDGMSQNVIAMRLAEVQAGATLGAARARLGPNHPEVRALEHQLAALRAAAGAETADAEAGNAADAQAAASRLATLRANLVTAQARGAREADAEVPLHAMEQDADATRMLLQALLTRMEQTAQQEAIETPDARILSRAEPPAQPSSPRNGLVLAAAVLAGLTLGGILAWLREVATTTFRTERDVDAVLGIPCLAAVPRVPGRRAEEVQRLLTQPGSLAARQVQSLRGRLRLAAANPRLLAITSTRPGEGKSTLALALARSAALAGERVLLVDCDRTRPNLSRIFAATEGPGLGEILAGTCTVAEAVRRDKLTGLSFIPAGQIADGSLRLAAPVAKATIDGWRRDFDLVLLDGAPMLASADIIALSELADAVLLCLRWHHTPRRLVTHVRDRLATQQGGAPLAVVLTRLGAGSRVLSGFPEAELSARRYAAYFRT